MRTRSAAAHAKLQQVCVCLRARTRLKRAHTQRTELKGVKMHGWLWPAPHAQHTLAPHTQQNGQSCAAHTGPTQAALSTHLQGADRCIAGRKAQLASQRAPLLRQVAAAAVGLCPHPIKLLLLLGG